MKIGILSDTHDRIENTVAAIRMLREQGAEVLIHCGDICQPQTIEAFADITTHFVFGNNDYREKELTTSIAAIGSFLHVVVGQLSLAGKEIGWAHSHRYDHLHALEHSNQYDYVFYGHTHEAESHRTGRTIVANPGALHRARPKTCLLLDLATGAMRTLTVSL